MKKHSDTGGSPTENKALTTTRNDSADDLMTVAQVAEWLQMSRKGIYGMVANRRLPATKVGRFLRFERQMIANLLVENRVSPGKR